jgi:3alpha(or 20beta)-hydroxysteroid dehydrogenase
MNRFEGNIILVTGGSGGQGAVEARLLVDEGARVVIGDVLEEEGRALADVLGAQATFHRLDVSEASNWQDVITICDRMGGLYGLINNAGVYQPRSIADTDTALLDRHFRVNQLGTLLGMKHAAPLIHRSGGGAIVNISSTAGMQGIPNGAAYGGTKWAVRGMTKTAALEFAPLNIRVNSVHPGLIDTNMLNSRARDDLERRATQIPMKRMGSSEDVAKVVLFLLSHESDYMTGAELTVDGGLSL